MNAPVSPEDWAEARRAAIAAMPEVIGQVGLPKALLPYQARTVRLLESTGTNVLVVEKSRRIGLTWALAAYAVLRAGRERRAGGMDAMYISYSQEMTREFVDACAMWARAFNTAAAEAEEFLFADQDETGDRSIQAFRIRFASGFEILALSSAPRTLRGKQGVVIIDEAAFVESLPELLKAALAFLMWGGQVVVCSTHDGTENPFNQLIQDVLAGRLPYTHDRIDFDQALRDGLYERICLVTRKTWTPEAEAQWRAEIVAFYGEGADEELFCVPTMGSGAWLSGPLIEARMTAEAPILRLELPPDFLHRSDLEQRSMMDAFMGELEEARDALDLDVQYAFGFDFARVADLTVGCLLSVEPGLKRRERLVFELRGVPGDEQKRITATLLEHVRGRLIGAAFDATGMGWTVAEDMGRKFGFKETPDSTGLIHAIKFTDDWYRVEMPPLKGAFEDGMIEISPDADHLSDLRTVRLQRGTPRVPALRTGEKGKRRHGDYAIALALAYFASRGKVVEFGYRGVPRGGDDIREDDWLGNLTRPGDAWWRSPLGAGFRGRL